MSNQFTNCKKCGTRNFSDDEFCGICNHQLTLISAEDRPSKDKPDDNKPNPLSLFVVFGGIVILYLFIFHNANRTNEESSTSDASSNYSTTQLTNNSYSIPHYTIADIELNNQQAFNVSVRIDDKLEEAQLLDLAQKVKSEISAVATNGVIFFLLPENEIDNGAWAAVDFKPYKEVRIIGMSLDDERDINLTVGDIKDYFGLWIDNLYKGDVIIRIRKDRSLGYVFEYISSSNPKPSEFATPLVKTKKAGKTIFKDTEHHGNYYVLENNGDLSFYDRNGYAITFKKLR